MDTFFLEEINLSPQASWDQNGTTVVGRTYGEHGPFLLQLSSPLGISITKNGALYISDMENHRIVVIQLDSKNGTFIIGSNPGHEPNQFNHPRDLFIRNTSLYVLDFAHRQVQKMSLNGSNPTTVFHLNGLTEPYYLYVDHNDNIYLSDKSTARVLLFRSNSTNGTLVAGTGTPGPNDNQLNGPHGVFVDHIGTVYIADAWNYRIMKWVSKAKTGIRVAGDGKPGTDSKQLHYPTHIIVDCNGYMYISEATNSRITRWAPNSTFGVCIVACGGGRTTTSTGLNGPHSLAFDSHGSLYVSDTYNSRVQKFQIVNSHSQYIIN